MSDSDDTANDVAGSVPNKMTDDTTVETGDVRLGTSQTTAYRSNTRKSSSHAPVVYAENGIIKQLLERDYAFLPTSYRSPGFLFRGLECGINKGVYDREFGINAGSHSLAILERELDVLLVSADFSDAFSVSRLWEETNDGGILVIAADTFSQHYQQHKAATLGFAEPGVVFKYPFFTNNLSLNEITYLIVHQNQVATLKDSLAETRHSINESEDSSAANMSFEELTKRLIVIEDDHRLANRITLGDYLAKSLAEKNIEKATSVQVANYPHK